MSKFRVIDGSNVTSIADRGREVKTLELEINGKLTPTDRELLTYAYHFVRLGHPVMAQKQLNRLTPGYFDVRIYEDLFQAMFAWSLIQAKAIPADKPAHREYEFFLVVKGCLEALDDVNFTSKPAFFRFRRKFVQLGEALTRV